MWRRKSAGMSVQGLQREAKRGVQEVAHLEDPEDC